ncbi:FRG domain-containing protein, partial [Candidatus Bathyarchaeota archaeon]|nr:FRG domain-containing protein [Candidatus Bathyarchaeota archaeon]
SFDEDQGVMKEYSPSNEFLNQRTQLNPIAFIYPRNIPRMQAQLSVYTIHHLRRIPIEKVGDRMHAWRYLIPKEAKRQIRKELSLLSIKEFQLFPEAERIGKNLAKGG